ncbi:isatin hydrolase-like [Mytilus trossulus]|uniref:isatin hydrolase-like n=1 Tax=Mytilus trossulus TaxID=6551 RepID=UPI003004E928
MNWTAKTVFYVLFGSLLNGINAATSSTCSDIRVVDLSHVHGPKPLTAPFFPPYSFEIVNRSISPALGGNWFETNYIKTSEHSSTHIDSPSHFFKNRLRMHELPLEKLYGPGVIIDVRKQVSKNSNYKIQISDIRRWESTHGRIPNGAVVLLNSGWDKRYPDPSVVFNTKTTSDITSYRFPSFEFNAITFLAKFRSVHIVGSDTPAIYLNSARIDLSGFTFLFQRNIPVVLNVANLDRIPPSGSTVFIPAINIYDGSGAPARIFATVPASKMVKKYYG